MSKWSKGKHPSEAAVTEYQRQGSLNSEHLLTIDLEGEKGKVKETKSNE